MIGHYLLTLTTEQEDRVLMLRLNGGFYIQADGCRCLRGAAENFDYAKRCFSERSRGFVFWPPKDELFHNVGLRYDECVTRFGAPRVNAAIRNRILSNRARRALAPVRSVPEPVA